MRKLSVPSSSRRMQLMGILSIPAMLMGCLPKVDQRQATPSPTATDPDAALKYKFRGIGGGEKRIDAIKRMVNVDIYINGDPRMVFASGNFATSPDISSYGGSVPGDRLVVPKTLRCVRWPDDATSAGYNSYPPFKEAPLSDVTVPVAERIPEDLLEDLRRNPKGSLRLKLRIHPDTLLVGWDIQRRPGFDPKKRDSFGEIAYVEAVHSFAGGDFREAKIYNGKVVRKGWYIHPKTGERIETDF